MTLAPDSYDPASHYNRVTEAWGILLGDELHYGYFVTGSEDLPTATGQLTQQMIDAARFQARQEVLDVGCGTGGPACRLGREFGVDVLGITTSEVGVAAATARAAAAGLTGVRFEVRDGTDNALPDASFDRVWVMESSHLMPDRQRLLSESARVLRPGGRLVLCDVIRRREIPFAELRRRRHDFAVLRAAHGAARMDPLPAYASYATKAGLVDVHATDITSETLLTFDRWQERLDLHREAVTSLLGERGAAEFQRSLVILRDFWQDGTLGYGLMSAAKPA